MRLHEILSDEEWQRFEQLIYTTVWRALSTYQQQRATQHRLSSKPAAALKPQAAKKAKSLARKAKRPPYAAPPKPLPQTKVDSSPTYKPIKTAKPLPPPTRMAVAKAKSPAPNTLPNKPTPVSITASSVVDQAARRMLPKDKQGQNPIDLLSLDERG